MIKFVQSIGIFGAKCTRTENLRPNSLLIMLFTDISSFAYLLITDCSKRRGSRYSFETLSHLCWSLSVSPSSALGKATNIMSSSLSCFINQLVLGGSIPLRSVCIDLLLQLKINHFPCIDQVQIETFFHCWCLFSSSSWGAWIADKSFLCSILFVAVWSFSESLDCKLVCCKYLFCPSSCLCIL